jgi:hypothetical protein
MNRHPIRSDSRWTVTKEWSGRAKPYYVVRFCGEWVDSRAGYLAAVARAVCEKAKRDGALVVTELSPSETLHPNPLPRSYAGFSYTPPTVNLPAFCNGCRRIDPKWGQKPGWHGGCYEN